MIHCEDFLLKLVNHLVDIYNTLCHSLDQGKDVRAMFCDIKKPLIGSGIEVFSINLNLLGFLVLFCRALRTI